MPAPRCCCATSTRQAGLEESLSRLRDVSLPKAVSELSMAQERAAVETSKDLTRMRHEVSHGDDRAAASTGDWAGDDGGTPGCCRSLVRWAWRRIACWQLWPSRRPSRRSRSRRYRQAARGACLPACPPRRPYPASSRGPSLHEQDLVSEALAPSHPPPSLLPYPAPSTAAAASAAPQPDAAMTPMAMEGEDPARLARKVQVGIKRRRREEESLCG